MKIIYWSPYVGHIGTIKAVINSATAMRIYGGHSIVIIKNHTEWEGYEDQINKSGIRIVDFGLKKWFPHLHHSKILGSRLYMLTVAFFGFFQLILFMRKEKPDILITNLISVPAILATRFLSHKPRVVASIQGFPKFLGANIGGKYPLWMRFEDAIRKRLWNLVYVYADLLVCMTNSTMDKLIRNTALSANKFCVINNPVIDENIYALSKIIPHDTWFFEEPYKRLVAVGRLTKQKDFITLIKAVDIASKMIPLKVAILGEGEERKELENEIMDRGLQNTVHLYGFISNPYSYLGNADLFVLTSLWEDPGHAILEAAALHIPIVSTDCPSGPADLLENGKGGGLCPVGDVNCLANRIVESLSTKDQDDKLKIAFNNAGQFSFKTHFNAFKEYLDLWEMDGHHNEG